MKKNDKRPFNAPRKVDPQEESKKVAEDILKSRVKSKDADRDNRRPRNDLNRSRQNESRVADLEESSSQSEE